MLTLWFYYSEQKKIYLNYNKRNFGRKRKWFSKRKIIKIEKVYNLINNNIKEVRFNNLFIANCYLETISNYHHIFKNIKNNIRENHTTFWAFNGIIYEIDDKEIDMTKETLIKLIDKFINICEYKNLLF